MLLITWHFGTDPDLGGPTYGSYESGSATLLKNVEKWRKISLSKKPIERNWAVLGSCFLWTIFCMYTVYSLCLGYWSFRMQDFHFLAIKSWTSVTVACHISYFTLLYTGARNRNTKRKVCHSTVSRLSAILTLFYSSKLSCTSQCSDIFNSKLS